MATCPVPFKRPMPSDVSQTVIRHNEIVQAGRHDEISCNVLPLPDSCITVEYRAILLTIGMVILRICSSLSASCIPCTTVAGIIKIQTVDLRKARNTPVYFVQCNI